MKKAYVKPEIYFESFELSANIATGCSTIIDHAQDTCGVVTPGIPGAAFTTTISGCTWTGDGEKVCYHVPTESAKLFSS